MAEDPERKTVNKLTRQQRLFVDFYIQTLNATESARLANYKHPNKSGPKLVNHHEGVQAEIESRLAKHHASAEEVLAVLSNHMRGSLGDFIDIDDETGSAKLALAEAKAQGKLGLLKKFKVYRESGTSKDGEPWEKERQEIELHDPQSAAVHLGKYHKLFTDKTELTGKDGESLQPNVHIYLPHNGRDNLGDDE